MSVVVDIKPDKGSKRPLRFRLKLKAHEIVMIGHNTQVLVEDPSSMEQRGATTPLKYPGPIRYLTIGYYARPRKRGGKHPAGAVAEFGWEGIPAGTPEAKRVWAKKEKKK